jgi:uncharacterized membrane protein
MLEVKKIYEKKHNKHSLDTNCYMKIAFTNYPIDIILCMSWGILLLPLILLSQDTLVLLPFSLPYVFFIPGYLIIAALFPLRKIKNINRIERITLSFGLSIAITSLLGFILNYSPWGIRLESTFITIFVFIISVGLAAIYRWQKIPVNQRYILNIDFSRFVSTKIIDKLLTIMIIISVILAIVFSIYIIKNPQEREPFTEFYLFGPESRGKQYQTNLTMGLNHTIILEINNHEYKTVNYTIDVWLINQSIRYDNGIVNWSWDFGDGATGYGESITHQYQKNGSYLVKLTVIDENNTISSIEQRIPVGEIPLTARLSYQQDRLSKGYLVNFISNSIISDSKIVNWSWDFGDGATGYGESITHQYQKNGSYLVKLTVIDENNTISSIEQRIPVGEIPLTARFSYEYRNLSSGNNLYFSSTSVNTMKEETIIHNKWFLEKITTTLVHTDITLTYDSTNINLEKPTPQWQHNFVFNINMTGSFKLAFDLFTISTGNYQKDIDYKDNKSISVNDVYRALYLWIDIFDRRPKAGFTYQLVEASNENPIIFTDNSTTPYSKIVNWTWDFGDGNTSSGEIIGLKFDGINTYVDCGTNSSLQPENGTIEAWVYIKDNSNVMRLFTGSYRASERRHPTFALGNNLLILLLTDNHRYEGHSYSIKLQTDTWYYVATTWNVSKISFYVKGLNISLAHTENRTQNFTPKGNTDVKRIGALDPPYNPEGFNGIMKDLRIYNQSLNSIELQTNYEGNVLNTTDLVSWWKMTDGGNITYDSGNIAKNDGIIHEADWVNEVIHRYNQPGNYTVTLTVINDYGQKNLTSKIITII